MSKDKFLTGLLLGAAAGAVAGILFAPDKGTETRKKIAKKADDIKGNIMEQVSAVSTKLIDTGKMLKGKFAEDINLDTTRPGQTMEPKMETFI